MCKYCYFRVKETTIDEDTRETTVKLLPLDIWRESYLQKHVGQKYWATLVVIVWFASIVLIAVGAPRKRFFDAFIIASSVLLFIFFLSIISASLFLKSLVQLVVT